MTPVARLLLLVALCAGALLVGVELMITAVALPRIILDLADWTELRRASWIVNGYLLAYIATMPLAGRAADRYGLPRLFMAALGLFALGCLASGLAQSLDQLIAARVVQGVGAGAILPLATAAASYLYAGPARARALGLVGACTFLGMALGPFLGALILGAFDLRPALSGVGLGSPLTDLLTPSWRWIFLLGAPLAIVALSYVWAAAPGWPKERGARSLDAQGAALFTIALATGLLTLTTVGEPDVGGGVPVPLAAGSICLVATALTVRHLRRAADPFLDPAMLRNRAFGGAVLVSLLTGYALATAIIGAAVYVDRVRYGGPDEQRIVLGSLALAMALGALASGFVLRFVRIVPLSLLGLAMSVLGMVVLSSCGVATSQEWLLLGVSLFGLGFGLTVTPRSTAAVEALGRRAFGMASAGVTVARTVGMAVGLAVLTGFGTQRIEGLSVVLTDDIARDAVLPPALRGRPLGDAQVIGALEQWAAGQAAAILDGLFLVAALVLIVAVLPTLLMSAAPAPSGRATIPDHGPVPRDDADEGTRPAIAG